MRLCWGGGREDINFYCLNIGFPIAFFYFIFWHCCKCRAQSAVKTVSWKVLGSPHTHREFVMWTRFCPAFEFWPPHRSSVHMLRVRNQKEKRMTAGLYLREFTESTGQLHQHASFLSFHRLALRRGCFGPYITALRQRADFIWKCGDPVRCLRGVRVGTLELRSVSALETDITATHICFRAFVRNEIPFPLSSFYCISPVRWDVWSKLLVKW